MTLSKLSPPLELKGNNTEEIIHNVYIYFYDAFLKKEVKPLYKGSFIFFDMNRFVGPIELKWPERFMHIISLEDKEIYEMYPCYNDFTFELCQNYCDITKKLIDFQFFNRIECLYRLSRVNWIIDIINLANKDDENIMTWNEFERDKNGNKIIKHYIRYNHGKDDYVIILEEDKKKGEKYYRFITAFPVFLKRQKMQFMESYKKIKK